MIELRDYNLKKMDLSQNYKLYKEMFKATLERDCAITLGAATTTLAIVGYSLDANPNSLPSAGLISYATPTVLMALYYGAIKLIQENKKEEAIELLNTLKNVLEDYNVEVDLENIEDIERLHRIKVPYDLIDETNADEDYDDNYFWFIDKNGKIQAIYQERDLKRKAKRFKYFLLEETDDEYKYIRKKAK